MKIGVIVYSYTNNTLTIAKKLESILLDKGYDVEVKSIKAEDESTNINHYNLVNIPSVENYDSIVFATCVRGFDCALIFKQYIQTIKTLKDKKVCGFVSQYFPFDFMGGSQALKSMKKMINDKEANFIELSSIHMKSKNVDKQIDNLTNQCTQWLVS